MPPLEEHSQEKIREPLEEILSEKNPISQTSQPPHFISKNAEDETILKTLRTYRGDVEDTIGKKNESVVSIAAKEIQAKEKKTEAATPNEEPKRKSSHIFLTYGILPLIGIGLLAIGGGALYFVYTYRKTADTPVPVAIVKTLIPVTDQKNITITPPDQAGSLIQGFTAVNTSLSGPVGEDVALHFLKDGQELSLPQLLAIIAPDAPDSLVRSLGTSYMAGIYTDASNSPFLILTTQDYGNTFAGMLAWEKTMQNDLSALFPHLDTISLASSSLPFSDDSFNNKNVRILRNEDGQIILVYGFFDNTTLAITENETIFQTLNNRYLNGKLTH